METAIQLLILVSFVSALTFLFQSMFILHAYETKNKKRPPSIQWWPFNAEMKEKYPKQSKAGRALIVTSLVCAVPWLLSWLQNYG